MTEAIVTIINKEIKNRSRHVISDIQTDPLNFGSLGVRVLHPGGNRDSVELWQMNVDGFSGKQHLIPPGFTRAYEANRRKGVIIKIEHKK